MKTLYVDEMFLLNLIVNYFILLATAKLCALPLKRARFGASAALGSAYSVLLLLPEFGSLASPVMKLVLGFVMTLAAFGAKGKLIKPFLAFLAVSAAFGGAVFAASLLAGAQIDDGLYINASLKVLALSFAACYCVLTLVFNRFGKRAKHEIRTVKLAFHGKTSEFYALRDTGNSLYDPISGLPVMVVGLDQISRLLDEKCVAALTKSAAEFMETLSGDATLRARFWLVPYSSVGQQMALLPVFRPDGFWIDGKEEKNTLVGLAPNILCNHGDYSAIL